MDANKIRIIRGNPRFRRYPEYKESGVEWIGKIPRHWKILPFMHCLKKVKTKKKTSIPKMDYQESGEFPVIDQGASFVAGWTDLTDSVISDNLPVVIFGDHTRIFKYVDFPFVLGADGTQLLYPNDDILNTRFFYYALLNLKIPNEGYSRHYGYLREFSVVCPALPTQCQIANFLDRKTEQIDELIRIKERQIELLQAQRTGLINQAVTKGLDPNVEMKPSGVEWIGEIPRHWNLSMLKYTARLVYGDTLISENREDGVVPVYGSNGIIDTHSLANTLSPAIIVGRKGSLGKIQYSDVPCFVIDTAYYIDRRTSHVNLRWLYYVLHALKLERFRNSVLPGLNRESTEGQYVPLITVEEQAQIVDFLDRKTEQIDELIAAELRKIELLKEYRQSLISEAVTGKIDVRNEV